MKTHLILAGADILYHSTPVPKAVNILAQKKFTLAPSVLFDEAKHGANWFFMSTSRTILSKYTINKPYAIFELDGRRLGQRYKIVPVNYHRDSSKRESEDRIFSASSSIPIEYVNSLHVPLYYNSTTDYASDTSLQLINKLGKELGLPVYFYESTIIKNLRTKRVEVSFPNTESTVPTLHTYNPSVQTLLQMILESPFSKAFETPIARKQAALLKNENDSADIITNLFRYQAVSQSDLGPPVLQKMRKHRLHVYSLSHYLRAKIRIREGTSVITDCLRILRGQQTAIWDLQDLEHKELEDMLKPEILVIKEYGLDDTDYKELMRHGDIDTVIDKVVYADGGS